MKKINLLLTLSVISMAVLAQPSLHCVKKEIKQNFESFVSHIPSMYTFSYDGSYSYSSIDDGGNDMYDGGNKIETNIGSYVNYSNGNVVNDSIFGPNGEYFTLELPGLFVLAADIDSVSTISTDGNNGADGNGSVGTTSFEVAINASDYNVFIKRIYGTSDPSINHMWIVAKDTNLRHTYSTNTNDDFDTISGLNNSNRVYYMLFASASGGYINDSIMETIATEFLTEIDNPSGAYIDEVVQAFYCPGDVFTTNIETCGSFNSGNNFTLEMSDTSGDFSTPTVLGTVNSIASTNLNYTIPNKYGVFKVRLRSSNPADTVENDNPIYIFPKTTANNVSISPGNTATLNGQGGESYAWYSSNSANAQPISLGKSFTTEVLNNDATYYVASADSVKINVDSVLATGVSIADNVSSIGDDRGGIAITKHFVFTNGDKGCARISTVDLNHQVSLPRRDGLFSDISTGDLYTIWDTSWTSNTTNPTWGTTINALRNMNIDLELGDTVLLDSSIMLGGASGMFTGFGFLIIYTNANNNFYKIDIPTGSVSLLATDSLYDLKSAENWASWGYAEESNGNYHIIYRENGTDNIVKRDLTNNTKSVIGAFADLADMASIIYSPWNNKLYFQYEYSSQFGYYPQAVGYMDVQSSNDKVIVNSNVCKSAVSIDVIGVGINEKIASNFKIYPNPTNGILNIEWNEKSDVQISMVNTLGKTIISLTKEKEQQLSLDLSSYEKGVYFLTMKGNGSTETKKNNFKIKFIHKALCINYFQKESFIDFKLKKGNFESLHHTYNS